MKWLLFALTVTAALAQPTEHVTVTGTKSRQAIESFVQSYAAPARLTGKLARWETSVCPRVIGLPPGFARYVIARLKAVSAEVGAPAAVPGCAPKVQIVFTVTPQELLDGLRAKAPDALGYLDNAAQRQEAAVMRRPIQAWYMTETVDVRGQRRVDSAHGGGIEYRISPKLPPIIIPHAYAMAVTGSRLGAGLRSDLHHVLILADPGKLKDYDMGALGDYIAMLALSQPAALDGCPQLPSILSLFNDGCEHAAALTDNDRAFLRGLYHMSPDRTLRAQEEEVAFQMEQSLGGK